MKTIIRLLPLILVALVGCESDDKVAAQNATPPPPAERFQVLASYNNEAVLDRETGLIWEANPQTNPNGPWEHARRRCVNKSLGGHGRKGWRLPSIHELNRLWDVSLVQPSSPIKVCPACLHWSSTMFVSPGATPTAWAGAPPTGRSTIPA